MKLPFTSQQFLDVFRDYNRAVWPMQLIFYALALAAVWFILSGHRYANRFSALVLSALWLWMGIAYHIMHFSSINNAAYLFGGAFIIQGLLFLFYGFINGKLHFGDRRPGHNTAGSLLVVFALAVYPLLGYLLGHKYPSSPTFGLPCPTTIFTFGLLLMNRRKLPVFLLIIPLAWSALGFSASFSLGIWEDVGLLASGLIFVAISILRNRIYKRPALS